MATADQDAHPTSSYAWCSWHDGFSSNARLVQLVDQGSGPAVAGLFACVSCRHAYDLVLVADQP